MDPDKIARIPRDTVVCPQCSGIILAPNQDMILPDEVAAEGGSDENTKLCFHCELIWLLEN